MCACVGGLFKKIENIVILLLYRKMEEDYIGLYRDITAYLEGVLSRKTFLERILSISLASILLS